MSLILEALKKVERERATPEQRGFLVLGPAAWAPTRSNVGWVLGIIAAAAVAGGAVYLLTRPAASAAPAASPADAQPAPTSDRADIPATSWTPPSPVIASRPRANANTAARSGAVPDGAPAGPVLRLHAISQQDGRPIAVVNERVVREGDRFDGVRILRIGAAEVEVEVDGARRTLRF